MPPKPRSLVNLAAACFLGIGCGLRVYHFLVIRSLWIDEARLALNVGARSWGELATPLWYDQTAPILFLWINKALFVLTPSEWALRLVSLLAGVASLGLLWGAGARLVGRPAALITLSFAALSPAIIYFSNEFKPYASDFFISCLLLTLAARVVARPQTRSLGILGAVGVAAPWFSTPSPLVLAGCAVGLLLSPEWRRARRYVVGTAAMWAVSTAACYILVLRPTGSNPYLQAFWQYRLLTPSADMVERAWEATKEIAVGTLAGHTSRSAADELESTLYALALLICAAAGTHQLLRSSRRELSALILVPLVLVMLAALSGLYPLATRVSLFAAPFWLLKAV